MTVREERGQGTPLNDAERQWRHFEQHNEWPDQLPPRGTGLGKLRIAGLLGNMQSNPESVSIASVMGLVGGGIAGYVVSRKWPNAVVTYISIVIGAELGVRIVGLIKHD